MVMMDTVQLALSLGQNLRGRTVDTAGRALRLYLEGHSTRSAGREAGVPEQLVADWVTIAGIKRSREEIRAKQAQALRVAKEKFQKERAEDAERRRAVFGLAQS
jgi:hypothetical protein